MHNDIEVYVSVDCRRVTLINKRHIDKYTLMYFSDKFLHVKQKY